MRELYFNGGRPVIDPNTGVHLVPGLNEVADGDAEMLLSTRKDVLDEARLEQVEEE